MGLGLRVSVERSGLGFSSSKNFQGLCTGGLTFPKIGSPKQPAPGIHGGFRNTASLLPMLGWVWLDPIGCAAVSGRFENPGGVRRRV